MGRFYDALQRAEFGAIAEVKRRSPSAGDLRPDADPASLARDFERHGASAVSILVDRQFAGSLADLSAARAASSVPLLGKGFFRTRKDLADVRDAGADAALLILRDLDDAQASALLDDVNELGLDALVEAHNEEELKRAEDMGAAIIGVNARDLSTFEIDRRSQLELIARAPADRVIVAESAIWSRAQGAAAQLAGADAMLVGSSLMRAPDPGSKLRELISRPLVKTCGITREEDVDAAVEAGADMIGFVLADSPRRAAAPLPVPETVLSVGVFIDEPTDVGTDLVQVYPEEAGHRARDGALVWRGREVAQVLDLPWGQEDATHWTRAAQATGRIMLSGGLAADNVGRAIAEVRPWAVDASRSLEVSPGRKIAWRMRSFVEAARIAGEPPIDGETRVSNEGGGGE